MTREPVALDDLRATRSRLIDDVRTRLDAKVIEFLLSLYESTPDFSCIGLAQAAELPAVKWMLQNVRRLIEENPDKHDGSKKC